MWVLEETRQTWPMFSKLKLWLTQKNFELSFFSIGQKTITRNSDFSLPSMISYVKVKFRVIVFQYGAKNDNSELGIFTSKHDSTCHKKFRVIVFMYRAKNDNSELGIHQERIPRFPRISSYRYGPLNCQLQEAISLI